MSKEIKIYQKDVDLSLYPKHESEIYVALQTPLIGKIENKDLFNVFNDVITKAYMISSYKPPEPSAFTVLVDETMKKYKNSFGFVRQGEIELIFNRGLSKEYGEFMGLSFITFVDWAKAYIKNHIRIKLTTPMEEIILHTPEELHQLSKQNAQSALNEFNKNGTVGRFGVIVYDFLTSLGILALDQQEKNEYWKEAKVEYLQFLNSEKLKSSNMDERKRIELDIRLFTEGGKKDRVVTISKRLIVDDLYRSISVDETDLMAMIDEYKN